MTKKSAPKKPTESAWIGEFKLGEKDRNTLIQYIDDKAIAKIEELVAGHRDLYRHHLQERLTAPEIVAQLMQINKQAETFFQSLRNLDAYSNSELTSAIFKARKVGLIFDIDSFKDELTTLAVLAQSAAKHTPENAGAGTRKRGQKPVPDALLVSKIASILMSFNINVKTVSTGSKFVKICQAISDSGGFAPGKTSDVRGPIRAYLNAINQ